MDIRSAKSSRLKLLRELRDDVEAPGLGGEKKRSFERIFARDIG